MALFCRLLNNMQDHNPLFLVIILNFIPVINPF
jgi:hypothetical protein